MRSREAHLGAQAVGQSTTPNDFQWNSFKVRVLGRSSIVVGMEEGGRPSPKPRMGERTDLGAFRKHFRTRPCQFPHASGYACNPWGCPAKKLIPGPKKTITARDVTGFYAFFSAWKSGNFLRVLGPFSLIDYTEKGKRSTGEDSKKSSGDGAPKLQISVPCRWFSSGISKVDLWFAKPLVCNQWPSRKRQESQKRRKRQDSLDSHTKKGRLLD